MATYNYNDNCGVYKLLFRETGDFYIGSSVNLGKRFSFHEMKLSKGRHKNKRIQKLYDDGNKIDKELVLICREEDRIMYEQAAIDSLMPTLNISKKASQGFINEKAREALSLKSAGKNNGMFGRKGMDCPSHISNLSIEQRQKRSDNAKLQHRINGPMIGKHQSLKWRMIMAYCQVVMREPYWGA